MKFKIHIFVFNRMNETSATISVPCLEGYQRPALDSAPRLGNICKHLVAQLHGFFGTFSILKFYPWT